jgi:hypothetical protein
MKFISFEKIFTKILNIKFSHKNEGGLNFYLVLDFEISSKKVFPGGGVTPHLHPPLA